MKFFDDYFVFSSKEKKGILTLVIIILLMIIAYRVIPNVFKPEIQDFTEVRALIEAMNSEIESEKATSLFKFNPNTISLDSMLLLGLSKKQAYNIKNYREKVGDFKKKEEIKKIFSIPDSLASQLIPFIKLDKVVSTSSKQKYVSEKSISLFNFDPNTVTQNELQNLGFSSKQAKTLKNFREMGGRFKSKEDLKKIYGVSDKLYQSLEPYIQFPEKEVKEEIQETLEIVELNSAKFYEIKKGLNITSKQAGMVISYREKIGGFVNLSQLNEVYGLEDFDLKSLAKVEINLQSISLININTATFKELVAHPYLSFSDVKKIVNYRDMHGDFVDLEQIHQNNLINLKQYRKIAEYLTL
ncbi:helix-hairpin-helix domain-containing protein [Flavobacteriales bacterium]|nr:helix-hairpin-helix domain-containing protein [Flavobacteriales bacterium]